MAISLTWDQNQTTNLQTPTAVAGGSIQHGNTWNNLCARGMWQKDTPVKHTQYWRNALDHLQGTVWQACLSQELERNLRTLVSVCTLMHTRVHACILLAESACHWVGYLPHQTRLPKNIWQEFLFHFSECSSLVIGGWFHPQVFPLTTYPGTTTLYRNIKIRPWYIECPGKCRGSPSSTGPTHSSAS